MKSTHSFDNAEIHRVSKCFTGTFEVRNRGLWFLLVIVGLFINGCGGDTDTADTGPAMFVEVKPPRVRAEPNSDRWDAEFDVVFNGSPVDLSAEFEIKTILKESWDADWEQTGNIVTLHFEFKLVSIEQRVGPTEPPDRILILPREDQKQSVEVTLTWSDGRKIFTVEAYPPESLFVGRSDILSF
ncbi:MAG: hypothetical protein OXH00_21415 [Candidatus Poribacteria bacterium]|nr:hypothetical protein [Candidatus Poribacteria bacterium]